MGAGEARFEALKRKLEDEGLCAPQRKRPLPQMPRTIGVVTSATGAAFQDILNVLRRRWPLVTVELAAAAVQGDAAAAQIVRAIGAHNRRAKADLLIVRRGGGRLQDRRPFNEEIAVAGVLAT